MVLIAPPPPVVLPQPVFARVQSGVSLVRMYDPTRFNAQPTAFRFTGPYKRFDHQREVNGKPALTTDRGIMYAGDTFSGCIVEVFGDRKIIEVGTWEVAVIEPTRELKLMDLRGAGAMKAGTVAAVCKDSNHKFSQEWSRYFYETTFAYQTIDGLLFQNAHNEETAYAFYERCASDFTVVRSGKLSNPALSNEIKLIAAAFNMDIAI